MAPILQMRKPSFREVTPLHGRAGLHNQVWLTPNLGSGSPEPRFSEELMACQAPGGLCVGTSASGHL